MNAPDRRQNHKPTRGVPARFLESEVPPRSRYNAAASPKGGSREQPEDTLTDTPDLKKQLNDLIRGYWVTQALFVAAELDIAGRIGESPKTAAALAEDAGVHADALYRILRALASIGIFVEDEAGRFGLTPMAETLGSAGGTGYARLHGRELYAAWGDVLHTVKTGEPAFIKVHGMPLFDYMVKYPDRGEIFSKAMFGHHGAETAPMIDAYDFSGFSQVVDVGGADGSLLIGLLQRHPNLDGVLFELPATAELARPKVDAAGLGNRMRIEGGSFFEDEIPSGADAYILRHIVHDFNDEKTVEILSNCRKAAGSKGRVLVVEFVIPTGNEPNFGKWLDLMMLCYGGKERTVEEYRQVYRDAGLRLTRVVPTVMPISVIEGVALSR